MIPDPLPSVGTDPYLKLRVTRTLSMLTTLSLSRSTAPVIWFSIEDNVDMTLLDSPGGFIDWFYADVEVVSFLGGLCCTCDFYSSWFSCVGVVDVLSLVCCLRCMLLVWG